MEADLGAVDEARERGLLVEKPVGDVELEEDHAEEEQRRLDEMCRELILEALSSRLEEKLADFRSRASPCCMGGPEAIYLAKV